MATLTLRPTSATGTNWQNANRVYDGNTSQAATVSINSSNYSQRTLTVDFSTSSIPQNAQITKATLNVIAKQSSSTSTRRITVQADINGSSSRRVINQQLTSTRNTTLTADIANYMSNLSSLTITGAITGTSSTAQTFSIYEIYVDVEYQEANEDVGQQIEIYLPQPLGTGDKLYWDDVNNRYFIQHSTGIIQTEIIQKIEFDTPNPYVKIMTNEAEVAPSSISVELAMKEITDDGGDSGGDSGGTEQEGDWIEADVRLGEWLSIDEFYATEIEYGGLYQHASEIIYLQGLKEIPVQGENHDVDVGIGVVVFGPDGTSIGIVNLSELTNPGTDVINASTIYEYMQNMFAITPIAIALAVYGLKNAPSIRYKLIR